MFGMTVCDFTISHGEIQMKHSIVVVGSSNTDMIVQTDRIPRRGKRL